MLESGSVCLKPLSVQDAEIIHQWKNDISLVHLLMAKPMPVTLDETKEWLNKVLKDKNQIILGIKVNHIVPDQELLIGITRLMFIDWINRKSELGIYIANEKYRGIGVGKTAINLILDYAFCFLNLHKIYLQVSESNRAAINLYKSFGFQVEGIKREEFWNKISYENVVSMGILEHEYRVRKTKADL
ncbi:GNAT family N-acetyltransferase [Thermosynechococcus sp. TG252]|uniref:GNAT family N-acetyltransferase n=1 Tax=Thermosynechococcus sp. TG252 TaxID=3074097 RepID=UPI00285672C1|nr:GNAT family N-acetyltransferase [Thermosynechococcus sp. TG252]MDR7992066.1 GNAT family N-acetyltransferase [Thermosynechococcus sp. TG252]